MKRGIIARGVVAVLAAIGVVLSGPVAYASVDDFRFSNFEADYYLTRDDEGRAALRVEESMTAAFPDFNQNKGIIRAIPKSYDGHSVSLAFIDGSLTRNGRPEPVYEKTHSNDNLNVSTGTDEYVTGNQVYTFAYTMRDVTKDFGDHQEFYWDTNGTEWNQPFDALSARVHLDEPLASAWTEGMECYQGRANSNESCYTTVEDVEGGVLVTFSATRALAAGENMTIVMAFDPSTFEPYVIGAAEINGMIAQAGLVIAAIVALFWSLILTLTKGRNHPGRGTIVPQYLPPKNVSMLIASEVYGKNKTKSMAAQLVDLAVRHNIQIVEYEKPRFIGKPRKVYKLRYLTSEGLNREELEFVQIMFAGFTPGQEYDMDDALTTMATGRRMALFTTVMKKRVLELGLRRKFRGRYIPVVIGFAATFGAFWIMSIVPNQWSLVIVMVTFLAMFVNLGVASKAWPLTESGRDLKDYIAGIRMYIEVAEEERLKILQSVDGATRQTIGDPNDQAQLVKLYERVLPYAIMMGLEKSWGKVLEIYYAGDNQLAPSWYAGTGAFNAAMFASSLSSFSATMSSNSASSGMGGGGFSGGGGGGGGGGGR